MKTFNIYCHFIFLAADVYLLVFSVDNRESFENARHQRDEIWATIQHNAQTVRKWKRCGAGRRPLIPLLVVGNKSDLNKDKRVVDPAEAKHAFDAHRGNSYIEGTVSCTISL